MVRRIPLQRQAAGILGFQGWPEGVISYSWTPRLGYAPKTGALAFRRCDRVQSSGCSCFRERLWDLWAAFGSLPVLITSAAALHGLADMRLNPRPKALHLEPYGTQH